MADDLLLAIIIAGFGLSGVYFRAAYVSWRRNQAAEREREVRERELHSNRLWRDEDDAPIDAKAARLGAITDGEVRAAVDRASGHGEWQSN
jgi:hypothetical protein